MNHTSTTASTQTGASAVEYGLIVFAIAAVIITVIAVIGTRIHGSYNDTCEAWNDASAVTVDCN